MHGDMQDGEVLRQDQIASLFNVSRIPVREALARLEAQGLVTNHRYKGAVVTALSVEEIAETFEFRALVEPEVIRRSVLRMSAEALAEAEAHCAAFSSETDPGLGTVQPGLPLRPLPGRGPPLPSSDRLQRARQGRQIPARATRADERHGTGA